MEDLTHNFFPFINSHLITISRNKYVIAQEEPVYKISKYVQYNFDKNTFKEFVITPDFHFLSKVINSNHKVLDNKKRAKILYESLYSGIPLYDYENLESFPELYSFLNRKGKTSLVVYGKKNDNYHLHIWENHEAGCTYVIVLDDEITAYHIDEKFHLQLGDSYTYVWFFDNNFVVSNEGDVYSVVLIPFIKC